jgi:hypothetical protein
MPPARRGKMFKARAVIIGDLHYGDKNRDDHRVLGGEILEAVDAAGPLDFAVCLGDELHKHNPNPEVRAACAAFLGELARRVPQLIVLVGNHTRISNRVSGGPAHALAQPEAGPRVRYIADPGTFEAGGLVFGAIPYMEPAQFSKGLAATFPELAEEGGGRFCCVFGHQEIRGCSLGGAHGDSSCAAVWEKGWPPGIMGHIHDRHVPKRAPHVLYPGTPMQHSHAEKGGKYIYLAEFAAREPGPGGPGAAGPHAGGNGCESTCGRLREIEMTRAPKRVTIRARDPGELAAALDRVTLNPADHHDVVAAYPGVEGDSSYVALLRLQGRAGGGVLRLKTLGAPNKTTEAHASVEAPGGYKAGGDFRDWLRAYLEGEEPEVREAVLAAARMS